MHHFRVIKLKKATAGSINTIPLRKRVKIVHTVMFQSIDFRHSIVKHSQEVGLAE